MREAVPAGVTLVQLRDHHLSDDDFVALGRRLVDVLDGTGVPLLIDDRVHLVGPIGAQGAHEMCIRDREILTWAEVPSIVARRPVRCRLRPGTHRPHRRWSELH